MPRTDGDSVASAVRSCDPSPFECHASSASCSDQWYGLYERENAPRGASAVKLMGHFDVPPIPC